MARRICRGKILYIKDLVTYVAKSPENLQQEFETAVGDYLETCKLLNREPEKPFRGQFNVRIPPELHRAAALRAVEEDVSLNDIVVKAIYSFLSNSAEVSHHVHVAISAPEDQFRSFTSAASEEPRWEEPSYDHYQRTHKDRRRIHRGFNGTQGIDHPSDQALQIQRRALRPNSTATNRNWSRRCSRETSARSCCRRCRSGTAQG